MPCPMALRLSEIFWLHQPIVHDLLSQLSATIFPKPAGMRLATYIVVAHFGFLKPTARHSRSAGLIGRHRAGLYVDYSVFGCFQFARWRRRIACDDFEI